MKPVLFVIRTKYGAHYVFYNNDLNCWALTFDETRAYVCTPYNRYRFLQEYLADNPKMREDDFVFIPYEYIFYQENDYGSF